MIYWKLWALWNNICRCLLIKESHWGPESEPACSHWECPAGGDGPQRSLVEYPWLRSRRSAKWSLENNTVCYCQEKLWVIIAIYLCLPPSVCPTHHRSFDSKKNKALCFYKQVLWFILLPSSCNATISSQSAGTVEYIDCISAEE